MTIRRQTVAEPGERYGDVRAGHVAPMKIPSVIVLPPGIDQVRTVNRFANLHRVLEAMSFSPVLTFACSVLEVLVAVIHIIASGYLQRSSPYDFTGGSYIAALGLMKWAIAAESVGGMAPRCISTHPVLLRC